MRITQKLFLLAASAIVALIVVVLTGWHSVSSQAETLQILNTQTMPGLHLMHSLRSDQQQIALALFRQLNTPDPEAREAISKNIDALLVSLRKNFKDYEASIRTPKGRELYDAERKVLDGYVDMVESYLRAIRSTGEAKNMSGPMGAKRAELAKLLDQHLALIISGSAEEAAAAKANATRNNLVSITIALAAILGVGVLSFSITRGVQRSLQDIRDAVTGIENNLDFTIRAKINGRDEIAETSHTLNRLLAKLGQSFSSIIGHNKDIAGSSVDMTHSAEQVACAATQQSDAAASMAAGIEELTVSINHVNARAAEARELSRASGRLASEGAVVIRETINDINAISRSVNQIAGRINELEKHSDKIASIVSVIKEVAEQTNLLALNAAIEAARAGEQGRGFAVVADEVRKLAERTSHSTIEIADMIAAIRNVSSEAAGEMKNAVAQVEDGVQRANKADSAIRRIGESSLQSTSMVEEIANSITEQSEASNNIAVNVEKIAQMAEESSSAAANSAAVAHRLNSLAEETQGILAQYRV
ncbi:methyl-accepting chemotaxis protein [Formivibrio citricus]|uniref:Methyl-accepting chemotaxis protein n=2 Tax=Formivibrio citricus TaxID=83765 RepID=A0A1I4YH06_9NEIS|nr:methyl-accepting chemotaxis protein [Formivibrio citricus]